MVRERKCKEQDTPLSGDRTARENHPAFFNVQRKAVNFSAPNPNIPYGECAGDFEGETTMAAKKEDRMNMSQRREWKASHGKTVVLTRKERDVLLRNGGRSGGERDAAPYREALDPELEGMLKNL